ncbi:hypothetical protein CO2235_100046 [Cupriavidus oxalaticus]|uniref:Uncharacterized protein n=1 Tax=Cupriavidus oxalaticus TaxID=96344 RepID=A0A976B9S6_9BURK|nr:hypothetical protein CO2235_100046 [Cupriavidus oxalaticus]
MSAGAIPCKVAPILSYTSEVTRRARLAGKA